MDPTWLQIIANLAITVICGGAIPFAFKLNSRLATIEAKLENYATLTKEISDLRAQVHALEIKVATK